MKAWFLMSRKDPPRSPRHSGCRLVHLGSQELQQGPTLYVSWRVADETGHAHRRRERTISKTGLRLRRWSNDHLPRGGELRRLRCVWLWTKTDSSEWEERWRRPWLDPREAVMKSSQKWLWLGKSSKLSDKENTRSSSSLLQRYELSGKPWWSLDYLL